MFAELKRQTAWESRLSHICAGRIGVLLACLVLVALGVHPPAALANPDLTIEKDAASYGPAEIVFAAGSGDRENDCPRGTNDGGSFFPIRTDLYTVPADTVVPGVQLSGIPVTVTNGGFLLFSQFMHEALAYTSHFVPGKGMSDGLQTGSYDVVFDLCQDGFYDPPSDSVDHAAFRVVVDYSEVDAASLADFKSKAGSLADHWMEAERRLLAGAGSVLENYAWDLWDRFIPVNSGIVEWLLGKLVGALPSKTTAWLNARVQRALANFTKVRDMWRMAQNDPPDPDFKRLTTLSPEDAAGGHELDVLDSRVAAAGDAAGDEAALVEALVHSIERLNGAALAGDADYAVLHARAVRTYATLLAGQLGATADDLDALRDAIDADPRDFDTVRDRLASLRDRARAGFGGDDIRDAANAGLSAIDIEDVRLEMAALGGSSFSRASFGEAVLGVLAAGKAAAGSLAALQSNMDVAITELEAQLPQAHLPTADAGGPYMAAQGTSVQLDGTRSRDPDGAITIYAWDLDRDGQFDDAAGPTPLFTPALGGAELVGLKVTDDDGHASVGYAQVSVSAANRPPEITSVEPATAGVQEIVPGDEPRFGVTTSDPDGDPVTTLWSLDGSDIVTADAFTLTAALQTPGQHALVAVASDGRPGGRSVTKAWLLSILRPDADSDDWRVNADCDDSDPAVNPGATEIPGNGRDDDCDRATPDHKILSPVHLFPGRSYPAGAQAGFVATADLDGDGHPDAVLANGYGDVSVLLGNPDGTFQPAINNSTQGGAAGVAISDFDQDGKLDLAVAVDELGPSHVLILLGNGDGTFRPGESFSLGAHAPGIPALGDLNGDGKPDVVVPDSLDGGVYVLLGNGDGTFQPAASYPTGDATRSVAVVDLNGDGTPDLVAPRAHLNSILVLVGNGDGSFDPGATYLVGSAPYSVASADLNGDGKFDVAVANAVSNTVSVLAGNGDATFQPATSYAVGSSPAAVTIGDLDSDGAADLVVSNYSDSYVSVLIGARGGTFSAAESYPVAFSVTSAAIADLDGDGHADLAVATGTDGLVALFGDGHGTFDTSGETTYPANPVHSTIPLMAIGDINNDDHADAVVVGAGRNISSVLLGKADGSFGAHADYYDLAGAAPQSIALGDLNRDGNLDLVAANPDYRVVGDSSGLVVSLGNGDGTFGPAVSYLAGTNLLSVAIGDLNNDGRLDVVVAERFAGDVLLGTGDGKLTLGAHFASAGAGYQLAVAIGDFNNDSELDVAMGNGNTFNDAVSIFLGNGDGTVQPGSTYASPAGGVQAVAVGDLNDDGRADLATYSSFYVGVLLNRGHGTFRRADVYRAGYPNGSWPNTVAIGDLNGDDIPDLAIASPGSGSNYGDVPILLGNGDGTFQDARTYAAGPLPYAIAIRDLNRDGANDLVVGGMSDPGNDVTLVLNPNRPVVDPEAPARPGAPELSGLSGSPNAGAFSLGWSPSAGASADVRYPLQHRDEDDAGFAPVDGANDLADQTFTFAAASRESEGTWRYRVRAIAGQRASAFSEESKPVKVDRTAPPAPAASVPPADYEPAGDSDDWYKDHVTVTFAATGDPDLPDGSSGSGLDTATLTAGTTIAVSGTRVVSGTVADRAGNVSEPAQQIVRVDADPPQLEIRGCPAVIYHGDTVTIDVRAGDAQSGLVDDPSGPRVLDSSQSGRHSIDVAASDHVGHEAHASCQYRVNTAPGEPGAPAPDETLDRDGTFTLDWRAASDPDGDPVSYTLLHRSTTGGYAAAARGSQTSHYTFDSDHPEGEGTWTYKTIASDGERSSTPSADSVTVKVDKTAPNPPTGSVPEPSWVDPTNPANAWYRDAVTVAFAAAGDVDLADGSAGSGVDPTSVGPDPPFTTSGQHTASDTVLDNAGNRSAPTAVTVNVDADPPMVSMSCPPTVALSADANATVSAFDAQSGLAAEPTSAVVLDASTPGAHQLTVSATDHVGHVTTTSCNYDVQPAIFQRLPPPPPPPPRPQPAPTPTPILPLTCTGRSIALLDVHRVGTRVEVSGLADTAYAGRRASIKALSRPSRPAAATIQSDGSFTTTLALPPRHRRRTTRYQATIDDKHSIPLKLIRQLTIISRHATPSGTRITAQLANPTRRHTITIKRQLTCTRYRVLRTLRTNRAGRFSTTLPPPAALEQLAFYRATAQRRHGRTYTLPIAIRATNTP